MMLMPSIFHDDSYLCPNGVGSPICSVRFAGEVGLPFFANLPIFDILCRKMTSCVHLLDMSVCFCDSKSSKLAENGFSE